MLMAIAEHPAISNTNHGSYLPPSWGTLYELTKVPEFLAFLGPVPSLGAMPLHAAAGQQGRSV